MSELSCVATITFSEHSTIIFSIASSFSIHLILSGWWVLQCLWGFRFFCRLWDFLIFLLDFSLWILSFLPFDLAQFLLALHWGWESKWRLVELQRENPHIPIEAVLGHLQRSASGTGNKLFLLKDQYIVGLLTGLCIEKVKHNYVLTSITSVILDWCTNVLHMYIQSVIHLPCVSGITLGYFCRYMFSTRSPSVAMDNLSVLCQCHCCAENYPSP